MGRMFQIVDLDGCISDDRWRRPLIIQLAPGEGRWADDHLRFEAYHNSIPRDLFVNGKELRPNVDFIILTSRPLRYRDETVFWLARNQISYRHLIMRNPSDLRPSVEVKREMVLWLSDPNSYAVRREMIVDAIDDRKDIVKMYRESGLPARVVNIDGTESE